MVQKTTEKIGEGKQKKVLSLVLCVAMMLSVMVVGAGAAFSDQSKIKNTEAVDACTALNIIGGYPDGSFKPEGNITRAEVTKMICVALNGGKNPAVSTNTTPTFSDVRNNANAAWAEGYIESCAAQGIVSGVGGGKFAPAGNVTGTQLAKMLLVALGYKSENEGFTGNAWATNVNTIASAKGLYAGLEKMDVSAALTRDSAARMIWNALQAYEVEYKTSLIAGPDGKLSTQITVQDKVVGSTNDKITLLAEKYDAWISVGTLVNVDGKNLELNMTAEDIVVSDYYKNTLNDDGDVIGHYAQFSKLDKDYSDLLGQKVKVVFKNGKTNEVIGVYATGDNVVYKTLLNNVEKDGSKIKFDGKSYSIDEATNQGRVQKGKIKVITIDVNGKSTSTMSVAEFDTAANKYDPSEVTFVDSDNNDKIDTAIIIKKTAVKVTYASSSEIVAGDTYKYEDENIAKDFAKDDYAVISKNLYKDCKDIVKAEVLNDTIKGFKDKDTKHNYVQYQIGSTWYNAKDSFNNVDTGDKVEAYVYNGVVFDISADNSNGALPTVAVVTGVGGDTITGDQVKLTFFDGTTKTVTLDKVVKSNDIAPATSVALGTAYSYSESKDGFKLTQLSAKKYNDYEAQEIITSFANTSFKGGNGEDKNDLATGVGKDYDTYQNTYAMDDNAKVVLLQASGKCKVVTGKQYKALSAGDNGTLTSAFTKKTSGLTKIMLASAYVNDVDQTGHSNDNYAYIVKDGYKTGDDRTAYTIWNGEKNIDVVEKTPYISGNRAKGMVIGYSTIDEDGYINDVQTYQTKADKDKDGNANFTAAPDSKDAYKTTKLYYAGVQGVNGTSWITVDGENKLNITKDTKILNIDSAADDELSIGKPGTALFESDEIADSTGLYYINAYFVMDETFGTNDNADLAFIVFDVKGKMDGMNEVKNTTEKPAITLATGSSKIKMPTIDASKLEAGKTYTLNLTTTETAGSNVKVTLTGAVFADSGKYDKEVQFTADKQTTTVQIIALGSAVTVKGE